MHYIFQVVDVRPDMQYVHSVFAQSILFAYTAYIKVLRETTRRRGNITYSSGIREVSKLSIRNVTKVKGKYIFRSQVGKLNNFIFKFVYKLE